MGLGAEYQWSPISSHSHYHRGCWTPSSTSGVQLVATPIPAEVGGLQGSRSLLVPVANTRMLLVVVPAAEWYWDQSPGESHLRRETSSHHGATAGSHDTARAGMCPWRRLLPSTTPSPRAQLAAPGDKHEAATHTRSRPRPPASVSLRRGGLTS